MKLVLYFCILILGHSAFAGSSGGFGDDDVPASRPSTSRPAVAKPASVKSYPGCSAGKWTSNADLAREMFKKILKYDENFPIRLDEDKKCKGTCAEVTLDKDSGVLTIKLVASLTVGPAAAKVCQFNETALEVTVDSMFGEKKLVIYRRNSKQVDVRIGGRPDLNNSYTIR